MPAKNAERHHLYFGQLVSLERGGGGEEDEAKVERGRGREKRKRKKKEKSRVKKIRRGRSS